MGNHLRNQMCNLRNPCSGQVVLEYFILFAVVAASTLVGLTLYDENVSAALRELFGDLYLGIAR